MKRSWDLGPVFAFECVAAARRPGLYRGRALFVLLLMIGLGFIWAPAGQTYRSLGDLAQVAEQFSIAVVSIQLALVALVAPAVTAGAVCVDKSRGTLHHVFVTDLTAGEIVAGKLAAGLLSIVALMACGLPVLALGGLLGGIDLRAILGAYLVTFAVAVVGSALALTFSVWARKPHQALLLTYVVLAVWALTLPFLIWCFEIGPPPTWNPSLWMLAYTNPLVCAFLEYERLRTGTTAPSLAAQAGFLGGAVLVAWALVALAARHVRPVALGQASRPARRERPGFAARLVALLPEPPLDGNPVLWREWHRKRPSRWTGRLWTAYAVASGLASALVIAQYYLWPYLWPYYWGDAGFAGQVNGWEVVIGLLLLSISAPLALAEERDRGSLDVIMTTPLSARTIVWGKWWGTFATVPRLAILPIWVTTALALVTGRWIGVLLVIGLIFAPAAAFTSLGLAVATWVARPGRAVAAVLSIYATIVIGCPLLGVVMEGLYPQYRSTWLLDGLFLANSTSSASSWMTKRDGSSVQLFPGILEGHGRSALLHRPLPGGRRDPDRGHREELRSPPGPRLGSPDLPRRVRIPGRGR